MLKQYNVKASETVSQKTSKNDSSPLSGYDAEDSLSPYTRREERR